MDRKGFTLVEVVVFFIVVILILLLMPAVHAAREAGFRSEFRNIFGLDPYFLVNTDPEQHFIIQQLVDKRLHDLAAGIIEVGFLRDQNKPSLNLEEVNPEATNERLYELKRWRENHGAYEVPMSYDGDSQDLFRRGVVVTKHFGFKVFEYPEDYLLLSK